MVLTTTITSIVFPTMGSHTKGFGPTMYNLPEPHKYPVVDPGTKHEFEVDLELPDTPDCMVMYGPL